MSHLINEPISDAIISTQTNIADYSISPKQQLGPLLSTQQSPRLGICPPYQSSSLTIAVTNAYNFPNRIHIR